MLDLNRSIRTLSFLLAIIAAAPASAIDGEILISNSTVNNPGGIGGGNNDNPGYPVTITKAGSYKLSGTLTPTDATAFIITANDVTINLNGFTIIGAVSVVKPIAGGPETFHGISASNALRLAVRNGTIRNFTGNGIDNRNGNAAIVENMRILSNDGFGVRLKNNSQFIGNTVVDNGGFGAELGTTSVARGNTLNANTRVNGAYNLSCSERCVVEGNVVANALNGGGVGTGAESLVIGNTISGNAQVGLSGTSGGVNKQAGFTGNVIVNNAGGTTQGILEARPNLCRPTNQFCD